MLTAREKPVRLSVHANEYRERREFTEAEVEETIRTSTWMPARKDRLEAAKDFPYNGEWNRRH
jgi:hypothetical protein